MIKLKFKDTSNEEKLQNIYKRNLSHHRLDHTQIYNLSIGDQTKVYKCFKGRQPPMEDDTKILKVEYLSNH